MAFVHTDNLSTISQLERSRKAVLYHEQIRVVGEVAFAEKPLPPNLQGSPRLGWDSSLLGGKASNSSLDISARKWMLACVVCNADQKFEDMLWLMAQWLLIPPSKARHVHLRYPVLRTWAWLRLFMAAEEGGEAARAAQYTAIKAFDPDSFYAIGALAVRSELCTREAERIVRQYQADDVAASDLSSESSDSDRSGTSHASNKISSKQKKGKQSKARAVPDDSASDKRVPSAKRQGQEALEGPKPKPKTTKAAALLAAANLALADAEAEKSVLLDRIRALEASEVNEGDRRG